MTEQSAANGGFFLRHPAEEDQIRIVAMIDEWFSGQRVRHLVGRAWFRHFGSTSWLAEGAAGAPIGLLVGYRSPDRPTEAVIHLIGVDPNHRRRGIGRALMEAFVADCEERGVETITALTWPGEPPSIAFFRALAFVADDGRGSRNLFGTTAFPDYDGPGEDRIVFIRRSRARSATG